MLTLSLPRPTYRCFTDLAILSNKPPHHGTFSRLKIHSTLFSARYCLTTGLFVKSAICLEADLKVLPLSETIFKGNPLLAVNLQKLLRKASAVKSETMSRWTAFVTQQVYKQIHTFSSVFLLAPLTPSPPRGLPLTNKIIWR